MNKIHVMDEILANRIAAGEVVEKCASVVKELVENSIDANAKEINIELVEAGTRLIRVVDDGIGMTKDDASICFSRHATSKIIDEDDLYRINTLGFRGEALPSIAAVSKVVLTTSQGDVGTVIKINGGKIESIENGNSRIGTIIEVSDLFYNTPARLKHIKSLYSELSYITDYVNKIALSNPSIKFTLKNNDSVLLETDGRGNLLKTIKDIYGLEVAKKMYEIHLENDDYKIDGYISYPEITRANKNHMITIVDNRVVKNSELLRSIDEGYGLYKHETRYPIVVLNIKVDPSLIDVNVHPTKMDIKFSKMDSLKDLLVKGIKNTLDQKTIIPKVEQKIETPHIEEKHEYHEQVLNFDIKDDTPYTTLINEDLIVKKEEQEDVEEIGVVEEKKRFPKMYPVGIIHGTFIVCQSEDGMYLVDLHAAEERINLEKILKGMEDLSSNTIQMIVPITIELTSSEFIILKENMNVLKDLKIGVEEFGVNSIIIKSHPTWIKEGFEDIVLRKIIETVIREEKSFDIEKFNYSVAAMASCKMSVKANTNLTLLEMEQILNDLSLCDNPFNCAHGRPTIIFYSNYDLLKSFKRTGFEIKN